MLTPAAGLEYGRATIALAAALNVRGEFEPSRELFASAATHLAALGASRTAARAWVEFATTLVDRGDLAGAVSAFMQGAASLNLVDPRRRPAAVPPAEPAAVQPAEPAAVQLAGPSRPVVEAG